MLGRMSSETMLAQMRPVSSDEGDRMSSAEDEDKE